MKQALPPKAVSESVPRLSSRAVFAKVIFPLIVIAAIFSGVVTAHGERLFEAPQKYSANSKALMPNLFVSNSFAETVNPFLSSLIVQIGFNPANQPESFEVGVSNPATQPLRIQTQNINGLAETVSGSGFTVFLNITTTSPTGRFDMSPTGSFTTNSLIVTVTSGRSDSQNFFYRDTTPGTVVLTATVTNRANTGLTLGETTSVTKSVIAVGENKLSFHTHPANTKKDATIVPPIKVRVEDSAGNLISNSTRSVTLAIGNNPAGGALNGDTTISAVGGIATFNNVRIDRAGASYTLVASAPLPSPALTEATSQPFDVTKLDQTISFDELEDKTYGDTDFALKATSSSDEEVVFTSLTEETCSVEGNSVQIVAAGLCTIRASSPGDADYDPADDVDRSFTIHKANATIVVNPYDIVYNGESHTATLVSITGVNGESDEVVGNVDLSGTVHTNAGQYSKDQWLFIGTQNYNETSGSIENHIAKASITAQAGGGSSTFDGDLKTPAPCLISGPGYIGDLTCSNDPSSVGPDSGSYSIASNVSGSGLSNFDIASSGGTYTIGKAPTVVTVSFESGPYDYRGSAYSATARVSGPGGLDQPISSVVFSGDCVNVTGANGCSGTAEYTESANHLGSSGAASISITRKQLKVTASSHVLSFGDAVPSITPSLSGFVAGESASIIDSLPVCSTIYVVGSPIGTYPTTCSGGSDNNYGFGAYAAGTVTLTSACSSFNGFLSPIGGANAFPSMSGPGGSVNAPLRTFKLNSTIPFKFTATCSGLPLTTGTQTLSAQKYSNGVPVGDNVIALGEDVATPDNLFRYADGQWHFNFKTKELGDAAQGTWLFEATLFDGSRYSVWLAIRK